MINKKFVVFVFLSLMLFGLIASFTIAQAPPTTPPASAGGVATVKDALSGISAALDKLSAALDGILSVGSGTSASGSGDGMVKLIVGIIMLLLFAAVLTEFDLFRKAHKTWIAWVISAALVLLGMRYIDSSVLANLFFPSAAYILAITITLQFGLIIYINHSLFSGAAILHRMVWWIWAFSLIWLLISNISTMPLFSIGIYVVAALAALTFGSKFDRWITRMFAKEEYETAANALGRNLRLQQLKRQAEADSARQEEWTERI